MCPISKPVITPMVATGETVPEPDTDLIIFSAWQELPTIRVWKLNVGVGMALNSGTTR